MQLSELAELLNTKLKGQNAVISSITHDTRELVPGQLYIAIKGHQFDGHDFLQAAIEKQAIGAIVSKDLNLAIPTIQVSDTRLALGKIAANHRSAFDLPVIAVTGSCGKTTIKSMLASILNQMGSTLSPVKSFNNDIGVPLTLLQLNAQHQYAVIEMGANHPNEIGYLSSLAKQNVAVVSNVAPAHLAGFGSLVGVADAKGEIYEALPHDGIAIINSDDEFAGYWQSKIKNRSSITFGIRSKADVSAQNIILSSEGTPIFNLIYPDGRALIHLPLLGMHNVMNALASVAASYAVGATKDALIQGLSKLNPVGKRLTKYKGLHDSVIIDDSYNANPLSVSAALEILAHYKGERILVLGDMAELGSKEEYFHVEVGKKAKNLGINKLYAFGRLSKHTVDAFGKNSFYFQDQESLIATLKSDLHSSTIILVKGSRALRMENIVQALIWEN